MKTLYWHDYETFGLSPARARLAQFAGIRTDLDLNIIDEPFVQYCKLPEDSLPHPGACLVTGITPQISLEKGVCEAEFAKSIWEQFSVEETCTVGYNNIEFDDEFTRYLFYRNLYSPYAHHDYRTGNSRWDLINVIRLVRALRPDGIVWPTKDDGSPTTRLDKLTVANGIKHNAHDALGDVKATIELAKLIRSKQPKLYQYAFEYRDKLGSQELLGYKKGRPFSPAPVIHISSVYGGENNYMGIVFALAKHPEKNNSVIVVNLREDPTFLTECTSVNEIKDLMFTKKEDLPPNSPKIPLYEINTTRCPVLCSLKGLRNEDQVRLNLNLKKCFENLNLILQTNDIRHVARQAYSKHFEEPTDPDLMLYGGGFIENYDKGILKEIHGAGPANIDKEYPFEDNRLNEMVFRYRARNYPETLDEEELQRWNLFKIKRLRNLDGGNTFSINDFFKEVSDRLSQDGLSEADKQILYQVETYGKDLLKKLLLQKP